MNNAMTMIKLRCCFQRLIHSECGCYSEIPWHIETMEWSSQSGSNLDVGLHAGHTQNHNKVNSRHWNASEEYEVPAPILPKHINGSITRFSITRFSITRFSVKFWFTDKYYLLLRLIRRLRPPVVREGLSFVCLKTTGSLVQKIRCRYRCWWHCRCRCRCGCRSMSMLMSTSMSMSMSM